MSKRNTLAALALGSAIFAGAAMADGKTGQRYTQGPSPLAVSKACPSGSYGTYDANGNFICRGAAPAPTYRPAPQTQMTCPSGLVMTREANGTTVCRMSAPAPVYRPAPQPVYRPAPAPVYRPAPTPVYRPAPAPSGPFLDAVTVAGFGGGVGNGIGGGFYGGGGGIIVNSGPQYSGVLNAPASAFTFNRRAPRPRPMPAPMPHNPCGGGCGGMGGGMMGGGMGGGD